jgi:hypothetical protein
VSFNLIIAFRSSILLYLNPIIAADDILLRLLQSFDHSIGEFIILEAVVIFFGLKLEYCLVEHLESHLYALLNL